MSLLPKSQQYRDDILCWPLGPVTVKPVAAKVDPNAWFDAEARKHPDDKPPKTAKKPNLRELEQAVFEEWLARTRPSGDVESVQCQWEESDEYAEFLDEHDPPPPSTEKPPKFKVGDRVRVVRGSSIYCDIGDVGTVIPTPQGFISGSVWVCFDNWKSRTSAYKVEEVSTQPDWLELIIPSEPKEADGWATHLGGPCPHPDYTGEYELRFKDGSCFASEHLSSCKRPFASWGGWVSGQRSDDLTIVAYRLVKQQ